MSQPDPTRQRAEALKIADSLTGYIAHVPGSFSCRHCELAQELADALLAAYAAGAKAQREQDAEMAMTFILGKEHLIISNTESWPAILQQVGLLMRDGIATAIRTAPLVSEER